MISEAATHSHFCSGIHILSPETSIADLCYGENGRAPMDPGGRGRVAVPSDPWHLSHSLPGQARTPASITSQCTGAWRPSGSSWAWRGWRWSSHWVPCFCTGAHSSGCSAGASASRKREFLRPMGSPDLRRSPLLHDLPSPSDPRSPSQLLPPCACVLWISCPTSSSPSQG